VHILFFIFQVNTISMTSINISVVTMNSLTSNGGTVMVSSSMNQTGEGSLVTNSHNKEPLTAVPTLMGGNASDGGGSMQHSVQHSLAHQGMPNVFVTAAAQQQQQGHLVAQGQSPHQVHTVGISIGQHMQVCKIRLMIDSVDLTEQVT
jgi:hypothetical protein